MATTASKFLWRLLPLLLVALVFTSCDDDDDPWGPPPPPADDEYYALDAWDLLAPPLCPEIIYPDSYDGASWFNSYDQQVTVLNSVSDVNYFFSREQLLAYPDLTTVDFRYYSVVIFTLYLPYAVPTYNYSWSYSYYSGEFWLDLLLNTYGPSPAPDTLALFQSAIQVEKIDSNAPIYVSYDYN